MDRLLASRWRTRPGVGLLVCGLFAALAFCLLASTAAAGEYTVWSCRGPEGTPVSTQAWTTRTSDAEPGDIAFTDDCAKGGSLAIKVTDGGIATGRSPRGEAVFGLPPGDLISGFKIWRYATAAAGSGGGYDYAAGTTERSDGSSSDSGCASVLAPPSFECGSIGDPSEPLAASNLVAAASSPLEALSFWAGCRSDGCEPPAESPAAEFRLYRSAVSIEDDRGPAVERLETSLAESGAVSGIGYLFVTAADEGAGVASFEFSLDGGAPKRFAVEGCQEPFTEPRPCPEEAARGIRVDTGTLSVGEHTMSGRVIDAAGNSTPFGPLTFTVARPVGTPGGSGSSAGVVDSTEGAGPAHQPDNGRDAVESPRLDLASTNFEHPVGKAAVLRGTLTSPSGTPIVGARLQATVSEVGGGGGNAPRTVRTDAQGRFAFTVGGAGVRRVGISYAPVLGGPATRTATATVRSAVALRLTAGPRRLRNGQEARFTGQLLGAGQSARGAGVAIQAKEGDHWATVENLTVGTGGKFSWAHRFLYVEREAIFSFRAVIAHTPGWWWPTERSGVVELRIEGTPR